MKTKELPSAEFLHKRFRYDDETGELYYRYKVARGTKLDQPVGTKAKGRSGKTYKTVCIKDESYLVHRIVYKMFNPNWDGLTDIDHIDNLPGIQNNRIENLRAATDSQNQSNSKKPKNNTTGYKGIYPYKGKFNAAISINNKNVYLGRYDTKKQAAITYDMAAIETHEDFARINFPQNEGIYKSLLSYQSKHPDVTVTVG